MQELNAKLKIGIIGTGNVATHLSLYLNHKGFKINSVVGRTCASAKKLARRLQCRQFSDDPAISYKSNLILAAVPDSAIAAMAAVVAAIQFQSPVVYIAHTSGSLPASMLNKAKNNTTAKLSVASFHPMQTFPGIAYRNRFYYRTLENIYFGIEGERPAVVLLKKFTTALGNRYVLLRSDYHKSFYHIGGIMACNFLTAILEQVTELYSHLGFSEKKTIRVLTPLIEQTILNNIRYGSTAALTGPAARNDLPVLNDHIKLLKKHKPELVPVYQSLSDLCRRIKLKESRKIR